MNKKGIIFEMITILVVLTLFIVGVMLSYKFVNEFNNQNTFEAGSLSKNITGQGIVAIQGFDNLSILVLIGLTLYIIVSAFFINSHPVFFVIGVMALLIVIPLTALVSNVFQRIAGEPEFSDYSNNFVVIPYIMSHLPLFFLIIGILALIGIYAKDRFFG